ncbi:MAG: penicillin-binding transpeptidase domain-containing protein [Mariprofundaceae bacterium]|nr:penicillin-binding transpeptidase domain-containing protein [Mariprofundaceae bacterium]
MMKRLKRPANRYRPNIAARTRILSIVLGLCFVALFIRAIDLHWWKADALNERAQQQHYHQYKIEAPRGLILDRHGRVLSQSIETPSIGMVVEKFPEERLDELANALHIPTTQLQQRIKSHRGFIWLQRQTTPAIAAAVKELGIAGVRLETEWHRFYPLGPETGHALGFVGIDGHGLEGIEHSFDRLLTGDYGVRMLRQDAHGRSLPGSMWLRKPQKGEPLTLTIDSTIQSMAYAALADGIQKHHARSGSVVVMRPKTGEVLAMASWPGFNPNNFGKFSSTDWRNRTMTDVFEPGSVMKPFTIAAALESGKWQANSRIFCENGKFKVGSYIIHDSHSMGWETLKSVVMHSSNIGAAKVALTLGPTRLREELIRFGFGERTGIAIEGEAQGILAASRHWGKVETANIAFGQGIAVTTMQLATAFSTLANHGEQMEPVIVARRPSLPATRVIAADTSAIIEDMLIAATSREGTGHRAVPQGYLVAGKTGTAQRADDKGEYSAHHYTSVFAGFVPAKQAEITIVVVVDEPRGVYYGGLVAAPIFRHIAASALPYLGIAPNNGGVDTVKGGVLQAVFTHNVDVSNRGLNFIGLSLREAHRLAARKNLDLRIHGRGWVVRQVPLYPDQLSGERFIEVWLDE